MCDETCRHVDLGFASARIPAGTHICQIYDTDEERNESLMKFIECGLRCNEKNVCVSDNVTNEMLSAYISDHDRSLADAALSGAFTHSDPNSTYFENGHFDPERMVSMLADFYDSSVREGYSSARIIGEMTTQILHAEGGSRLLEYESRVSILLRDHPLTAVCQYNANDFDGAMIMDVLKVHPMMIVRGAVINNPFFIEPEQILADKV